MRLSIPGVLIICGALLVAPAAEATDRSKQEQLAFLSPQARIELVTSDGYDVSVEGSGRQVTLTVERGLTAAAYTTRGRAWPGGMRARFGRFGRVSVRLEQGGRVRPEALPPWCKGKPALVRSGVFTGTIRFRGEDGYVSVDARRAKGRTSTRPRRHCSVPGNARTSARGKPRIELVNLEASLPGKRAAFFATGIFEGSRSGLVLFGAIARERRGSVRINRSSVAITEQARTFSFEGDRFAKVKPPKPFHGSAIFKREADGSVSWTGTLSASAPGASIPLTGPGFKAKLKRPKLGDRLRPLWLGR